MQTRVDEVTQYKHLKMTFVEFLEGIARAANYLSYPPATLEIKNAYKKANMQVDDPTEEFKLAGIDEDGHEDFEMSVEELIAQPLNKKIENILPYLLIHCTKRLFKKKWEWPVKNPRYGLYEDMPDIPATTKDVKTTITKGLNQLIFNKLNIKDLIAKKNKAK